MSTYAPQNHAVALLPSLSFLANQAPIESDRIIEAWIAGLTEGAQGKSLLPFTDYEAEDNIPVEASVWQDNLDRELGASLGTLREDEVGKQKLEANLAIDGVCLHLYLISHPSLITSAR